MFLSICSSDLSYFAFLAFSVCRNSLAPSRLELIGFDHAKPPEPHWFLSSTDQWLYFSALLPDLRIPSTPQKLGNTPFLYFTAAISIFVAESTILIFLSKSFGLTNCSSSQTQLSCPFPSEFPSIFSHTDWSFTRIKRSASRAVCLLVLYCFLFGLFVITFRPVRGWARRFCRLLALFIEPNSAIQPSIFIFTLFIRFSATAIFEC